MKRKTAAAAAVLTLGIALVGSAVALGQGDSLISLSYLEQLFIPTAVSQGNAEMEKKLDEVYDAALNSLYQVEVENSVQEGLYSYDFSPQSYSRETYIQLGSGSGFFMLAGNGVVAHDGVFLDVTEGIEVGSGQTLLPGHRYLVGENTTALVAARSGLLKAGVQGGYSVQRGEEEAAPFLDVSMEDWYSSAVDYAYFNGLFAGMGEDQFAPMETMNRAMMMTVLYHLADDPKEELEGAAATFTDVSPEQWYAPFVSWAAEQGVSAGTGEGKFSPGQSVTREQVVVLLHNFAINYMGLKLEERADITSCTDYEQIAFWSQDALSWAVASGVTGFNADGALEPARSATRAEVASMLMNFSQRYL